LNIKLYLYRIVSYRIVIVAMLCISAAYIAARAVSVSVWLGD